MTCGFVAKCGRPLHHRGHHGGWRSDTVAVNPVIREDIAGRNRIGTALTPREQQVLAEYAMHGSYKELAECLGMSEQTAKNHGAGVMGKTGATSIGHALYVMGWVSFPAGVAHREEAS